jgi:excisionase family DNA binding protein
MVDPEFSKLASVAPPGDGDTEPHSQAQSVATSQADPHYTPRQAAEYLGVSISTLNRWEARGIGPERFQLGSIVRYRKSRLDAFIAGHSGPRPEAA